MINLLGVLNQLAAGAGGVQNIEDYSADMTAHSFAMIGKEELENTGKIYLPARTLQSLQHLMKDGTIFMFVLTNPKNNRRIHAGVMEFSAENNQVLMPYWMLRSLGLDEGSKVKIKGANLKKGNFVKLRPLSQDFYDISNHKAVLQYHLRNFTALTKKFANSVHLSPEKL